MKGFNRVLAVNFIQSPGIFLLIVYQIGQQGRLGDF
jgi:hypothetical protein